MPADHLLDQLNTQIVNPTELPPSFCVTRHRHRDVYLRHALPAWTSHQGVSLVSWQSTDHHSVSGQELTINYNPGTDVSMEIPALSYFAENMPYLLCRTLSPMLTHYSTVSAVKLYADPSDESTLPQTGKLNHLPAAIAVRCSDNSTHIITPIIATVEVVLTSGKIRVRRRGFPLTPALAFTDYAAQGVTFQASAKYALDVFTSRARFASVYVPFSRFRQFTQIQFLLPLWTTPIERTAFIQKLRRIIHLPQGLLAAVARLNDLERDTTARLSI